MDTNCTRSGTTLLELTVALAIVGVLLGFGLPLGRTVLDRGAAVAAREEAMGLLHRARTLAMAGGGATLVVRQGDESMSLLDGDGRERERVNFTESRIDLRTSGAAAEVSLSWNELGWGRVTSRTLEFRRGAARARLVISSRGRGARR